MSQLAVHRLSVSVRTSWCGNNDGLPQAWRNCVAFVGYDTAGDSGLNANDAHLGLDWVINPGTGGSTTVHVRTVYGAQVHGPVGDVNGDGSISLLDVRPFIDLLTADGLQCETNTNEDGAVTLLDVDSFVNVLTRG